VRSDRTRSSDARPGAGGAQVALCPAHDQRDADLADFHIRILSIDGRSIVHVSGELDAYTAARLRDSLAGLISAGSRHIVVDLADVSFMGASGIGVLVGACKRLHRDDGKLLLRSAPPSVQKLIEITGLDAMLPRI
jgi:anti-sigma B factor antagonist